MCYFTLTCTSDFESQDLATNFQVKHNNLLLRKVRSTNEGLQNIEIDDIISLLQDGKCTGPFSIPVKLVKVLKPYISQPLANIFNQSIILGIFPDKLKYAKVISIHKKGSPTDPSNYRPISLLSIFSKIFEKLMHKRLYEFLDKMNIFYSLKIWFQRETLDQSCTYQYD